MKKKEHDFFFGLNTSPSLPFYCFRTEFFNAEASLSCFERKCLLCSVHTSVSFVPFLVMPRKQNKKNILSVCSTTEHKKTKQTGKKKTTKTLGGRARAENIIVITVANSPHHLLEREKKKTTKKVSWSFVFTMIVDGAVSCAALSIFLLVMPSRLMHERGCLTVYKKKKNSLPLCFMGIVLIALHWTKQALPPF